MSLEEKFNLFDRDSRGLIYLHEVSTILYSMGICVDQSFLQKKVFHSHRDKRMKSLNLTQLKSIYEEAIKEYEIVDENDLMDMIVSENVVENLSKSMTNLNLVQNESISMDMIINLVGRVGNKVSSDELDELNAQIGGLSPVTSENLVNAFVQ